MLFLREALDSSICNEVSYYLLVVMVPNSTITNYISKARFYYNKDPMMCAYMDEEATKK